MHSQTATLGLSSTPDHQEVKMKARLHLGNFLTKSCNVCEMSSTSHLRVVPSTCVNMSQLLFIRLRLSTPEVVKSCRVLDSRETGETGEAPPGVSDLTSQSDLCDIWRLILSIYETDRTL